jgi:hypothetical protein
LSDSTYYKGNAIWVSVRRRFAPRMTEWIWAVNMLGLGIGLLLPYKTFSQPMWKIIGLIMSENTLGSLLIVLGVLRLGGLIVNGARKRVTPWIRMISAGLGFFIWLFLSIAFSLSGVYGPGIFTYAVYCIVEAFNIWRAAKDTGEIYAS